MKLRKYIFIETSDSHTLLIGEDIITRAYIGLIHIYAFIYIYECYEISVS